MSLFCETVLALGLTFFGVCETAPFEHPQVEEEEEGVWDYAPPPAPAPIVIDEREAPTPVAEPQVIIQYIEKEPEPLVIFPEPPSLRPEPKHTFSAVLGERRSNSIEKQATWSQRFSSPLQEVPIGQKNFSSISSFVSLSETETMALPASFSSTYQHYQGTYEEASKQAGEPVNNALVLASDRYISGVLETGINSQVGSNGGGSIVIQTNRHVFGYHGRNILIPKGSRLQCAYVPPDKVGVTRISMTCNRILFGGNRVEIFGLAANVGDVQGRGGVSGSVDNRFWEKYGTALLITALSAGVQAGGQVVDSGEDSATAKVSEELSKRFGEITASVLQQAVDIRPVITIAQGTRVQIRPSSDWYINQTKGDER